VRDPQIHILNFDEDGGLRDVLPKLDADTTDIVVFSHGWHEDQNSAATHGRQADGTARL
jgi:hypothetical protein